MSGPTVVAVIQARMGSSRLPGKVLFEVAGNTILGHVIGRVASTRGVDKVVVATTTLPEDDPLVTVAREHEVAITRGASADVLGRYTLALEEHRGDVGVRVTADCPCLDPGLLAQGLEKFMEAYPSLDYLSNTLERSFPRGYDFEVFRVAALVRASAEAQDEYSREHVTPFLYRNPRRFTVDAFRRDDPHGTAAWRLTLDTMDDWRVLEQLFEALTPANPLFGLTEVERYLINHPGLLALNRDVEQKS